MAADPGRNMRRAMVLARAIVQVSRVLATDRFIAVRMRG